MTTVWITNDSGNDYSKAAAFGVVRSCSKGPQNIFAPHEIRREVAESVGAFDPAKDIVLVSGNLMATAFWFSEFVKRWHPDITEKEFPLLRVLMWDSKKKEYFVQTVQL